MTDLEEALCNPLLVTDERFDLTREAADEIERLRTALATCRELREYDRAEIERLRAILGKAYQFISPLSDPMGITNKSMADEIMAALAGKVQP